MVVQNTDYFNSVVDFPVIDNMAQSRVLSIPCPDILAALAKPGIAGQKVKRGRQIINVSFGLFVAPLGKRIQPNGLHIVLRPGRETVLPLRHAWQTLLF